MKKNKKALSLVIAIWVTLVMSLLALFILEYMFPFAKNTKWIENSVVAYYLADSGIEDALYFMSWASLWAEKHKNLTWVQDYSINMIASWTVLPPAWEWNSEFDKNFNIIRIWEPIQLEIWHWKLNNLKIYFKVPKWQSLSNTNSWIINWQLIAQDDVLNASWSQITWSQINWDLKNWKKIFKNWWDNENWRVTSDDSSKTFSQFYSDKCNWSNSWCILKMSVINELKITNWYVPYLEWKIENNNKLPLRYTIIKTKWRSYWFEKSLKVRIPQQTVNEAYDFTVFQ
jgi:hypothetical protein